jgi:hypothetical protein
VDRDKFFLSGPKTKMQYINNDNNTC